MEKSKLRRCFFIGNCQSAPLKYLLNTVPEFNTNFEFIDFPEIYVQDQFEPDYVMKIYEECDLIITQRIYNERYGLLNTNNLIAYNNSNKRVPVFIIANVYFAGFYPFLFTISGDYPPMLMDQCGIILWCFSNGFTAAQAVKRCKSFFNDDSYKSEYVRFYELSLQEMEAREKDSFLSSNVSYLFRNKYRQTKLMHDRRHPTNVVYELVANNLLFNLSIFKKVNTPVNEFQSLWDFPVLPAIRSALNMSFEDEFKYCFEGSPMALDEHIFNMYGLYSQNPDVVTYTIDRNRDKFALIDRMMKGQPGVDLGIMLY